MAKLPDHIFEVGLIGFGAFGQLAAQHLAPRIRLLVYDPAWPPGRMHSVDGVTLASLIEVSQCPIVILAVPVDQLEQTVNAIEFHVRPGAVVLDVGSVKVKPAEIMLRGLPSYVDIIATHPLFGPQSASSGIHNLKIVICPVRGKGTRRIAVFLRRLGLKVIVATPDEHDHEIALVQGLTHLIAQILIKMEPLPTAMTTRSFELLMQGVNMVRHDSPELLHAIERTNPYAKAARQQFLDIASQLDIALSRDLP